MGSAARNAFANGTPMNLDAISKTSP